jgi:hypothetical protein
MRVSRKKRAMMMVALGAALLFILIPVMLAEDPGTLNGTLLDPGGAALPNREIALVFNHAGCTMGWNQHKPRDEHKRPRKWLRQTITDNAGTFSIKLPPGYWDVFAYPDGFRPACRVIYISPGETVTMDLRLQIVCTTIE